MPLAFHPDPGMILICDYSTGFMVPEMVKVRPVVVVSPRRRTSGLVSVVPLSSAAPNPPEPWHCPIPLGIYPPARGPMWAKCDMVATVGLARLDRVKVKAGGHRTYHVFQVDAATLAAIRAGVKVALGLA